MNTLSERIKSQRKNLKLTQGDIAKKIGISRVSYTQWELGETNPKGENLLKLAAVLHCTADWLISGKGHPDDIHDNVEAAPRLKGLVPVISEVQAGHWTEIKTGFDESDTSEWVPTQRQNSRYAFALRVVGDSMFNPYEKKSLSEGMTVIVDPEVPATHRSVVVARLVSSEKATVKELVIDGDNHYLRPYNQQYSIIPVTEGVVIIGVVVGAYASFI